MLIRSVLGMLLIAAMIPLNLVASTIDDLQSASADKKTAFVLVIEPGASAVDRATNMINDARKEIDNSVLIELDRTNKDNSGLVKKYRLSGAPVPLILVFSSNGVLAGGIPANSANSQKLVNMIPSPKKAELLKSIQSGQSVFVTASRKGMTGESEIYNACMAACGKMQDKSRCILIDMDDKERTGNCGNKCPGQNRRFIQWRCGYGQVGTGSSKKGFKWMLPPWQRKDMPTD